MDLQKKAKKGRRCRYGVNKSNGKCLKNPRK